MTLKKTALSIFVIAASAAYVWFQSAGNSADDPLGAVLVGKPDGEPKRFPVAADNALAASASPPTAPAVTQTTLPPLPAPASEPGLEREPTSLSRQTIAVVPAPAAAPSAERTTSVPIPHIRPVYRESRITLPATHAAMSFDSAASYTDGTYTGPAVDAFYGLVQIQAIVRGGQITALRVLQYPSDRRTSVAINRQALPMLRDEVVSAQTANVDIVSGATLTSEAFIRSLDGALQQANGRL
jgi:uncharacterized protein with FMN-binding domain